jgi:hypothetical protein
MAEGFGNIKKKSPEEQRRFADSFLEQGFTALAKALQEVGILAMVSKASDREITELNASGSLTANEEFQRITEAAVIQICLEATDAYVEAARRALRFDEQEGSDA